MSELNVNFDNDKKVNIDNNVNSPTALNLKKDDLFGVDLLCYFGTTNSLSALKISDSF